MAHNSDDSRWIGTTHIEELDFSRRKERYVNIEYSAKGVMFSYVEKHREIIDSYAEKGFRYVGFVPTEVGANGCIRKIDLVFEK